MWRHALLALTLLAAPGSVAAQSTQEEKAEIVVTSFRKEALTVKYDYVFSKYAWNLITYALQPEAEITYRRPANLMGCEQLTSWGIDQGKFTISTAGTEICSGPLSICDQTNYAIEVHDGGCKWKRAR